LLPADCADRPCFLRGGPVDVFGDHSVSCKKSGFGDRHLGTQTFSARSLPSPEFPMTAGWTSPETDAARLTFC